MCEIKKEVEFKGAEVEQECFVIMPIGDNENYEKGHFKRVYEDIFKPAIEKAGFKPYRADDGGGSQHIQIDIIKRIIEAPMAICDLSTRNPNVLFELGIRQAFDKPVALVQETGTLRIFDISTFNTLDYRKERIYHQVMEDREKITKLIEGTYTKHINGDGINSIVRLIGSINPAIINEKEIKTEDFLGLIYKEISELKNINYQNTLNSFSEESNVDVNISLRRTINSKMRNLLKNAQMLLRYDNDNEIKMEKLIDIKLEIISSLAKYEDMVTSTMKLNCIATVKAIEERSYDYQIDLKSR